MDLSLCSPNLLFKFVDYLQEECKLGHGGRLGYIDAISELINFRKVNGASNAVLRSCGIVPKKGAQDRGKDDEIVMDTGSRH